MPDWRRYVRDHLPPIDARPERESEIVEELALQLEAAYESAIARGASPEDARQSAVGEVPDWSALARTLAQIETPDTRHPPHVRGDLMTGFVHDLRHAARGLMRSPNYSVVAVMTLALALGLGAAAFSILDAVVIRPLPYLSPERLVLIKATVPPEGRETVEVTLPDARDLAAESSVFASMAAVMPYAGTTTITEPPSRIEGFEVSASLFSMLGITPSLGRAFTSDDASLARPGVVVIGYGFWQRLGAPRDIVGRSLMLDEAPRTIVGVAPPNLLACLAPAARALRVNPVDALRAD